MDGVAGGEEESVWSILILKSLSLLSKYEIVTDGVVVVVVVVAEVAEVVVVGVTVRGPGGGKLWGRCVRRTGLGSGAPWGRWVGQNLVLEVQQ